VYDKTVRRRRAVLALLVALSLILLTAYFGESAGGGLHSVQRGFLEVVSPIQAGANKALKPVRDLFSWFGDTLHAKGQVAQLRKQNDELRARAISSQADERQLAELRRLFALDSELKLSDYTPVTARVIGRSPTLWYSTVNVDKGSGDGVHVDDPVVDGEGLVGKVTLVTPGASQVTLITDHTSGVSAMVNASGASGIVQPAVGDPNDLLLQYLQNVDAVKPGDNVVTSGTVSNRLDSLFPPGIPIGQVTSVDAGDLYKSVHVRPFASLNKLDYVQVLTRGTQGVRPNQVAQAVASLPPPGSPPGGSGGQGASGQTFSAAAGSGGSGP
jgi:rod shape-determining protein MreC